MTSPAQDCRLPGPELRDGAAAAHDVLDALLDTGQGRVDTGQQPLVGAVPIDDQVSGERAQRGDDGVVAAGGQPGQPGEAFVRGADGQHVRVARRHDGPLAPADLRTFLPHADDPLGPVQERIRMTPLDRGVDVLETVGTARDDGYVRLVAFGEAAVRLV